jgi:NH3-dependent NAD+ synthetase
MTAGSKAGPSNGGAMKTASDPRLQGVIDWIRRTTDVAGGRGALVPVSGGSDSALCFWLCAAALPAGRAIAAYIGDGLRCRSWFESVGPLHVFATPAVEFVADPEALRWAMMSSHARRQRCWTVGSRNRTEDSLGTYSLASRVATYLPLAGLWKSEVMALCETVGVPREITDSSRRPDPDCGRPAEMAAIPFELVDRFLQVKAGERPREDLAALSADQLGYLESTYGRNQFKKDLPLRPVPERQLSRPPV